VWHLDGSGYLARLEHPVVDAFPGTRNLFTGLDINATEIITASGDTLR
jgi:hypothetical protein